MVYKRRPYWIFIKENRAGSRIFLNKKQQLHYELPRFWRVLTTCNPRPNSRTNYKAVAEFPEELQPRGLMPYRLCPWKISILPYFPEALQERNYGRQFHLIPCSQIQMCVWGRINLTSIVISQRFSGYKKSKFIFYVNALSLSYHCI